MDPGVREYLDGITPGNRPLFDRVHRLVLETWPGTEPVLSYGLPTYRVGSRKLHVGAWRHGISLYGWAGDRDAGFTSRHPELLSGERTIRMRPQDAAAVTDDELRDFIRAALTA